MNKELIQKFLNNACWDEQAQYELEDWINVEKFAELIIQECGDVAYDTYWKDPKGVRGIHIKDAILENFGVE